MEGTFLLILAQIGEKEKNPPFPVDKQEEDCYYGVVVS
jgi:hypothetical protein